MSKLQILIPQYNETDEQIKPLLDSIAIQQKVDLKHDIEVFIGNDGSDTKLTVEFLKTYTYPIQYHYFEHGGLAATRYKLQHLATADYIMFCDADDYFISTIALDIILRIAQSGCDAIICDFLEEHPQAYVPHHNDSVFVHGKIYRRQFLVDNRIEWNPNLREHQDSAFNIIARTLAAKNTRICSIPLYLWHHNPDSICRKDGKYHAPNTWPAMIMSYDSIVEDLKNRGLGSHAAYYATWCLYATYYEMAHAVWSQEDVNQQRLNAYKALVEFARKHDLLIDSCKEEFLPQIDEKTKQLAMRKGSLTNDMPPFEEWLGAILKIF